MLPSVSVTNLETFRQWQDDEELDVDWLLARLRGDEETPAMALGKAFHRAMETIALGEVAELTDGAYRFTMNCDAEIAIPTLQEMSVQKQYGELLVRGRVDALSGREVTDYKSTQQFDPDRLMFGYQWRFYLDITDCDSFCWKVFALKDVEVENRWYAVKEVHTLRQKRYPELHEDCERLAADYLQFAKQHLMAAV
jgi:hypothetical protein